jgi:uncharacterized protein (TIGR02099 family)
MTRTLAVVTRLLLWLVLAAWGLFALSWGALHLWIVPRIGDWRPELERLASRAVGVPVQVAEIRAESRGDDAGMLPAFMPTFELRNVRLFDAQGRIALQLPLVRTSVSIGSLWRLSVEQLVIQQPVLDVRRTAQGRIEVAGLDVSGAEDSPDSGLADWFFSQPEFVIQGGTVRWSDELRQQPPLALDGLDLVVRNTARTHQIRLDATPPSEWGERLSLRARLSEPLFHLGRRQAEPGKPWQSWDGQLYADFPRVDVANLRAYVDLSRWGVQVRLGHGALRGWADVTQGAIAGATLDMALNDVDVQLGPALAPLVLDDLDGRLAGQWDATGFGLSSNQLQFRTRQGEVWPGGRLQLLHTVARAGRGATLALSADQIDLAALSAIASRLPLSTDTHSVLNTLQPEGRLLGLSASWKDEASAPAATAPQAQAIDLGRGSYQAKGRIEGLALAGQPSAARSDHGEHPLPGRPGIRGATVDFDLDRQGGRAQLSIAQGSIDLPGVFEESVIPLDTLQAEASWRIDGSHIEAELNQVRLSNADAQGTAQVRWHTGDEAKSAARSRFPGVLDLSATLTRGNATRVHRYLPMSIGPQVRRYVREALTSGSSSQVDFRVRGDLFDMPFNAPGADGEFRIAAQLKDVDFAYVPGFLQTEGDTPWPGLKGVNGELVLDRASLRIKATESGVVGAPNVRLSQAQIGIDDLAHTSTLVVSARAQGPATEVLGFVRNSPVNFMTGQALAQTRVGGPADVQFRLNLPLFDLTRTAVNGTVAFAGNDLQISPDSPLLGRATGTLRFSESGFSIDGARAQLYGGEARFEGGMRPDAGGTPRIAFAGQGQASAEALRVAGLGFVSRLFQNASGSTAYTAQLGFRAGVPELQIDSDLKGLTINLPAPLGKSVDASLPLRYERAVLSETDGVAQSDRLRIRIGTPFTPLADLQYERALNASADPRVLRGSLAVGLGGGEVAPMPVAGVAANIHFDRIDVDAWERAFASANGTTGADLSSPAEAQVSLSYLPTLLAVRADKLTMSGRSFNRVVLGGSREDALWRANIDANELNGYVEVRQAGTASAGSIYARLARLDLAPAAASEVEQMLQQPRSVPALDIAVEDFVLSNRRLGRVEVQAVNRGGTGRMAEWRLNRLELTTPEARLSATGNWAPVDAQLPVASQVRRTALDLRLDIDDSGKLLERFGRYGLVRGGKGRIEGKLNWQGSPMALDYPSLGGQLNADFERGQFLKVEPGAAKLLSVLSLQSLPRRLALDFRDVFSEGFAFDFVRGDARIEQGVLFTNNLQMKGVNAAVLMEGSANIARETQDLNVVVVPEINAGTASLIATAINPAIGLGTFLAQFLLREPLQSAATQQFHITGGWDDPQVTKVERQKTGATNGKPAPPQ